jgi:hypothetical protein
VLVPSQVGFSIPPLLVKSIEAAQCSKMAISLEIPDIVYPGQGKCLICLRLFSACDEGRDASSLEHLIPEALCKSGQMVITDGTCVGCNGDANTRFEQSALHNDFNTAREMRDHTALSLTIAKIGYCFATAELGVDTFDGNEIRALLRGERDDVYNFVGGLSIPQHLTDRHLHKLYIKKRGNCLTVIAHLFASCKMDPYEVVVGTAN